MTASKKLDSSNLDPSKYEHFILIWHNKISSIDSSLHSQNLKV